MLKKKLAFTLVGSFILALGLAGCSHTVTGSDGSQVTVDPGGKVVATGANGDKAVISGNGQQMTLQSKNGATEYIANNGVVKGHDDKGNSLEMGTGVTEDELGLPFYPGSSESKNSLKSATDKDSTVVSMRLTNDDPAKVLAFYTDKLGKPATNMSSDQMVMAVWKAPKKTETLSVSKSDSSYQICMTVVTEK